MPERIISSAASSVPARTNAGATVFASAGKMYFCSQSISARSSASPRYITMGAWPWVLIRPGMTTRPRRVDDAGRCVRLPELVGCAHRHDVRPTDGYGAWCEHAARRVHGDHGAARDEQIHRLRRGNLGVQKGGTGDEREKDDGAWSMHAPIDRRARAERRLSSRLGEVLAKLMAEDPRQRRRRLPSTLA